MNSVANPTPPIAQDDSLKRIAVMMTAAVLPIFISSLLTGLFYLLGNYEVVERVPASTEFASISFPEKGKAVGKQFTAKGTLKKLPDNKIAYLMAKRDGLYWPKKYLGKAESSWSKAITEAPRKGSKLSLVILAMDNTGKSEIDQWYANAQKTGKYPGIKTLSALEEIASVEVKQQ